MVAADDARPLNGRRIALLETREADRLRGMLRERGAEVVSCPTVIITDAADPVPVVAWIDRFIAQPCNDLVLLTGEGLTRLHALAGRTGKDAAFRAALGNARTITRGPKPARMLRQLALEPHLRAKEPTTEGIITLLAGLDMRGRRVGVQLYPGAPDRLPTFLNAIGAVPDVVTPYGYAPFAPDAALAALIDEIAAGEIDTIVFTSAAQVRRLLDVAQNNGQTERLTTALGKTAIAAVGPVVEAELQRHGLAATIVPHDAYFMKPLVTAIAAALG